MVLKFFETLDSAANYIEKEENENGLKYVRRSVEKSFGSDSKLSHSVVMRLLRMWYDCSIIFPRETYAIGNYTSITVTLLMNKCRILFASCSNSTSKFSLVSVYKSRHQHVCKVYRI